MPGWLQGLICASAPILISYIWNLLLSRERSIIFGWTVANVLGTLTKQRLGKQGSHILTECLSTSLDDFTFGIRCWLQGKPKPTKEELKARAETFRRENGSSN